MNGPMTSVEPISAFLPDVQGRAAVEKVSTILREGRSGLISAADNYLNNEHIGGLSSGNVEVGVKPAMESASNGVERLDSDYSDPAILIKDTVAHMRTLVDPVVQQFEAIASVRTVGGSADELESQINELLQQMLAAGEVDMAKQVASEIDRLIASEVGQIRGDAGMMEEGSVRIERGLGEEGAEFDRRSRGLEGDSFKAYRESLQWQRRALSSVEDAALRKGEPLRQKCRQVVGEVGGVEEVWRQFTSRFFATAEK